MKCVKCGKEVPDGALFCAFCGSKMESEKNVQFCVNCGAQVEDGAAFCQSCGSSIKKADDVVAVKTTESKKLSYGVIMVSSGNTISVVNAIKEHMGLSLSVATKLAKKLPLTLKNGLTEDEANSLCDKLNAQGIVTQIETQEADEKASEHVLTAEEAADVEKRKGELKTSALLNTVAAVIFAIASIIVVFIPFFSSDELKISLFDITVNAVKNVIAEGISNLSYWDIIDLLPLLGVLALTITFIFTSVKNLIEKVKELINFEEYSKKELKVSVTDAATKEVLKKLSGGFNSGKLFSLIGNLILIVLLLGGGAKVLWISIIIVCGVAVVGTILEKMADSKKTNALKKD